MAPRRQNINRILNQLNRQQPRRRRRQARNSNNNRGINQKIDVLARAVEKLAVTTTQAKSNGYNFFRGPNDSAPSMPHAPSLETDIRLEASKVGMSVMSSEIKAAFLAGAGEFTRDVHGKVAFHLNFQPRAGDIKATQIQAGSTASGHA